MIGFLKLRRGLTEHVETDKLDYSELGLYAHLMMKADYNTGVVYIRTEELASTKFSVRQIHRLLDKLEEKRYLRTFRKAGSTNKYPILINKHQRVKDGKLLNAFKSSSCEDLVWEDVKQLSSCCQAVVKQLSSCSPQIHENKEIALPKEVRSKELRRKEVKQEETDMSFKNNITDKALEILGVRVFPSDQGWETMNSMKRVYGAFQVEQAFSDWADSVRGENITYPLTAFLRVANKLLEGESVKQSEVKPLVLDLSYLSDNQVTFNQKQAADLGRLLETYPAEEIKAAFKEFLDTLDDFSTKFAARDFTEKAEQFIYTRRKRREEIKKTEEMAENILAAEKAKAAKEIVLAEEKRKMEEALIEDTI